MNDIFISYVSEDRPRAERLAEAFQARGWSVWWDPAGQMPSEIRQAKEDAKCEVLLFSELSIEEWALNDARYARKHGVVFFLALLDEVEVPLTFRALRTVSLVGWQGGEPHAGFDQLVDEIARILGTPRVEKAPEKPGRHSTTVQAGAQTGEERRRRSHWRTWIRRGVRIVVFATGLVILVLGAWALARRGLDELNASATVTRVSSLCEVVPGFGPEMIVLEGGPFQMRDDAGSASTAQQPVRTVTVKPFAIGTCEVTFEDYDQFAQATKRTLPADLGWGRGRRPVINVSWDDAKAYAAWLSQQTGKAYRLPTEAEWEYAARSGGKPDVWAGTSDAKQLPDYAVYNTNRTEPVGGKKPNGLGLNDMSGNVWEWVEDCWHDNYEGAPTDGSAWEDTSKGDCGQRVLRGGSWFTDPVDLRASFRFRVNPDTRNILLGFRLVQDMNE